MEEEQNGSVELAAKLEALLFIYGEPMELTKLQKILSAEKKDSVSEEDIQSAIEVLSHNLKAGKRGIRLARVDNTIQLVTADQFTPLLESMVKAEVSEALTPAALETLSIITYGEDVPRSTVDYIRGVNSSFIIRALLVRGLIDRIPDPKRTNAYLYRPSMELLNHLGVQSSDELPERARFQELITKLHEIPVD